MAATRIESSTPARLLSGDVVHMIECMAPGQVGVFIVNDFRTAVDGTNSAGLIASDTSSNPGLTLSHIKNIYYVDPEGSLPSYAGYIREARYANGGPKEIRLTAFIQGKEVKVRYTRYPELRDSIAVSVRIIDGDYDEYQTLTREETTKLIAGFDQLDCALWQSTTRR